MTDIRKKILKKINQGGSMMVEAMAMLALIALVTPTLYKKSAERTTELQDINTASHIRTLSKAVDNYVATNYQALLAGELSGVDSKKTIELTDTSFTQFLPYGYSFDNLKNFGVPKVVVKRQGDSASVTAFVQLPKKTDIGEMRAARIASMVGSNGGYVNADKEAKGVGGVWSLDTSGLTDLGFDDTHGSVVVASSEAINSATSGALENEKYLQRTPVENEADLWRNTMTTDLYMGGLDTGAAGTSDMHSILGVEQMIIGATSTEHTSGLVLEDDRSAWIGGGLNALNGKFSLGNATVSGITSPVLNLYGVDDDSRLIYAGEVRGNPEVKLIGDGSTFAFDLTETKADLNIDTFTVGSDDTAHIINATTSGVELHKGKVKIKDEYTSANHKLYVGMEESEKVAKTPWLSRTDHTLEVKGNAYISDNLEVHNKMVSQATDTGKLRAGRHGDFSAGPYVNNSDNNYWLTVSQGENGSVQIHDTNPGYENGFLKSQRFLVDNDETKLFGVGRVSKVDLGATNAILQGGDEVDIYTTSGKEGTINIYTPAEAETDGVVSLQNGAIVAAGNYTGENTINTVDVNADEAEVYAKDFKVHGLDTGDGKVREILAINGDAGGSTNIKVNEKDLFRVDNEADGTANVEIDEEQFLVSYKGTKTTGGTEEPFADTILKVDYSSNGQDRGKNPSGIPTRYEKDGSVYIRRGAIEIENTQGEAEYDANDGMGYVEASRFVSNAWDGETDGGIATPVYSGDYYKEDNNGNPIYGSRTEYDRYMVNPAYTSVMHDIKLTTRGGSRLSDILPDFINKGIYVVTNTYPDNIDINNITAKVVGGSVLPVKSKSSSEELDEIDTSQLVSGADSWASPFMGVVPAPQCPPGHSKVITVTPAGFQMAQATNKFVWTTANNPIGDASERYVLYPGTDNVKSLADNKGVKVEMYDVGYKQANSTVSVDGKYYPHTSNEYFLGYTPDNPSDNTKIPPTPLTFQQSTWLKSKAIPQADGVTGNCQEQQGGCGAGFVGWSAIMGFIYPGNHYLNVIQMLKGDDDTKESNGTDIEDNYYWNIFPVQTGTMEAYATVYCYFDRTNMQDSGNDGKYVDQYDQLNNFRLGYDKTNANAKDFQDGDVTNNNAYINRLDDPTLKYNDPW